MDRGSARLARWAVMALAVCGMGCLSVSGVLAAQTCVPGTIFPLGCEPTPRCVPVTMQPAVQEMAIYMLRGSPDAAEWDFLGNMMRLDAGQIRMSDLAASRALVHVELRQFAKRAQDDRVTERDRFLPWLREWYQDEVPATTPIRADVHVIGRLACLTGCEFEIEYMLATIRQNLGVLAIAGQARDKAVHGRISTAASKVAARRIGENGQLRKWLACWYGIDASVASPAQCM